MLVKLNVRNYILIHDLEIDLGEGYSVITGETGAGKSILLGAMSLILGQRADTGILLDKDKKCIIEGQFSIEGYNLQEFFMRNELDFEKTLTLRREINQAGKSRAFINDTPVNLPLMRELGERLVNIHSQNSITTLNDSNFQLAVIDSYATIQKEVIDYRKDYIILLEQKRQLARVEERLVRETAERDYYQFLLDELNLARLVTGEVETIESHLEQLTHAEEIKTGLYRVTQEMSGEEESILSKFADIIHLISGISKYKPDLKDLSDRLNTNYIDIKDIVKELTLLGENVVADPDQIETLSYRLDQLYRLLKKHKASSIDELIALQNNIESRFFDEEKLEDEAARLRNSIAKKESSLASAADQISKLRQNVLPGFEKDVVDLLARLGIPKARFQAELSGTDTLSHDGADKVRFLFSANTGIELRDLSNAASGGELSRLMLTIKSMISQKNLLPTIIFDEIDNGVSGEIAGKISAILQRMGKNMQVIAITHLPQIAAKGDRHYQVYKSGDEKVTRTYIRQLSAKERVSEIAKMLSNETVTDSALQTASELINN